MDNGYKIKLRAAIVESADFQQGINIPNPTEHSNSDEVKEALNNLSYAVLDLVVASISPKSADHYPFGVIKSTVQQKYHEMMLSVITKLA